MGNISGLRQSDEPTMKGSCPICLDGYRRRPTTAAAGTPHSARLLRYFRNPRIPQQGRVSNLNNPGTATDSRMHFAD